LTREGGRSREWCVNGRTGMKRLIMSVFAMVAACAWGATPFALSFGETAPESADVYGLHLSLFAFVGPRTVTGLSLGAINSCFDQELWGIQASGLVSAGGIDPRKEYAVYGCQLAGLWDDVKILKGIQVAGGGCGANEASGLQVAGIICGAGEVSGIQAAGFVSQALELRGLQFAGLISSAYECRGLQVAFWTSSTSMCGVQVGVMNFAVPAKDGWVVQIGLLNGIGRDENAGWIEGTRYFPGINIGW